MALRFREAEEQDIERIVEMLADDVLGQARERFEKPLPQSYLSAIQANPNIVCLF